MKTWKFHPLHTALAEILEKGPTTDSEIYDLLKESYKDLGFGKLNAALMNMEIEGKISVTTITKGKRRVELIDEKTHTW